MISTDGYGHLDLVENMNKPAFSNARDVYVSGVLSNYKGTVKECFRFTEYELKDTDISADSLIIRFGRLYPIRQNDKVSYIVSCILNNRTTILKLSESKIKKARVRAGGSFDEVYNKDLWNSQWN